MTDALFSCRNCIHNSAQTLNVGVGVGFCLKHNSVIQDTDNTTCKHLHRKDLPFFAVEEGVREHAAEFAFFPGMVTLSEPRAIRPIHYSERFAWERKQFSPSLHALAQYHKMKPHWIMVQSFAGGVDGIKSITHASLTRHYLFTCGRWETSYRLFLALLQEIDIEPHFDRRDFISDGNGQAAEREQDALWDVVFARISGLQEYGWHAGIEDLTWITDSLNGSLSNFDWKALQGELAALRQEWTDRLISHAREQGVFFTDDSPLSPAEEEIEE